MTVELNAEPMLMTPQGRGAMPPADRSKALDDDLTAAGEAISEVIGKISNVASKIIHAGGAGAAPTAASARPANLAAYSNLYSMDNDLYSTATSLLQTLQTYRASCPDFGQDHTELADTLGTHARAMMELDDWVGRVGGAFTQADQAPGSAPIGGPVGVMHTTNDAVRQAMTAELNKELSDLLSIDAPHAPPPWLVNGWWFDHLTKADRDTLIASHPDIIGNLDGIPCVDRDQANKRVLREQINDLNQQLQDTEPIAVGPVAGRFGITTGQPTVDPPGVQRIKDQLARLYAIQSRLNNSQPPAYLLGLDVKGNGRAIIAINDPDTANNVITYVPGTGAGLYGDDFSGDIGRSEALVQAANTASPGQITSSITWIGYDAPQSITTDATKPDYAKNAEASLHNFEVGLRVTHEGGPSRNTIIGHSYGSTVVGFTMAEKGLPVDNVIFVGSPGVGVEHASDLGIDPSHVYVGDAANDPVPDLSDMLGSTDSEISSGDYHGIFGRDPSVSQFGAAVLPTDPGDLRDPSAPWYEPWKGWGHAHSEYFDPNSKSLNAMGQVAVGQQPHG